MLKDDGEVIANALLARQVLMHRANVLMSVFGSLFAAGVLAAVMWNAVSRPVLLGWLGLLAAALTVRLVSLRFPPRAGDVPAINRVWLLRFRLGFLAQGILWGLVSAMPLAPGDTLHLAALIVLMAGIIANGFTLTSFDLTAALLFGTPALAALSLRLVSQTEPMYWVLGVAVIATLVFLSLSARRAHLIVRKYEVLRLTEAAQAEALRSSEDLLERTGLTAGVGGWELDLATMALRLTTQAYRIHDVDPVQHPTFEGFVGLYGPEQQTGIRAGLAEVVAKGTPYDRVLPIVTVRGRRRWVRLIGHPQLDAGKVVRINGVVQDVTEARGAEQALADKHHLLTLLVRTTSEGFWFVNADGVTTDVNPAMCTILGRPRSAIVGKTPFEFVDAENAAILRGQLAQRAEGQAGRYEITLSRPDGSSVACFNNATPIFDTDGRHLGSIGMYTDISETKRVERQLRATGDELAQKSATLQLTLDSIGQGLVSVDASGRINVHNRRMLELLDLPDSLFKPGVTLDDVARFQAQRGDFGPGSRLYAFETWEQIVAKAQRNRPTLYVRETPTGGRIEVRTILLADGAIVRTYSDVTAYFDAQRALRDSEAELRALLDAFPGHIAVLDAQFRYSYVNEQLAELIGKSAREVIGRPVREILGDARFERLHEHLVRARAEGPVTVESEFEATAHRPRTFVQVTHAIGSDEGGGRHNYYAFGTDISARAAAEQALLAAKDEAERANLAKSQFLSSMSHELRTPMNAILGFGQLLVSDPKNPLPQRQREHVQEILRGARHLLSLINEVLDLALVETGKLRILPEPVDVAKLLDECLALLRPLARKRGIELSVVAAPGWDGLVVADRTRLKQVLLNLLSNAIKYNRDAGLVSVACTDEGETLRIGITDTGPGLGPEQQARLFQAFERLDAERTAIEGAGLGLALSQRLMQAMRGEIGLDSEPGRGSTFWIRLPRAAAADGVASPDTSAMMLLTDAPRAPGPRKVLYIEDNPVNVLLMEAMLARMPDLQLLVAPLPALGLQMAADESPDLILLDIQLPGMDGYEVLRRLRLEPACREIPVIAVSANAMDSDIQHGLAAGFDQYLTKPLDMRRLLAAVEAALALRQAALSAGLQGETR